MNSITRGPVSVWLYLPKLPPASIAGNALKTSKRTLLVTLNTSQLKASRWRSVKLRRQA